MSLKAAVHDAPEADPHVALLGEAEKRPKAVSLSATSDGSSAASRFDVGVALAVVALVYGCWALVAKAAMKDSAVLPMVFAFYRCVGGAAVMTIAVKTVPGLMHRPCHFREVLENGDLGHFALLGLLMAGNIGGNIMAVDSLSAMTVSIFQPMLPVISGVLCAVLGVETLCLYRVLGIGCCALGAMVVVACGEAGAKSTAGGAAPGDPAFAKGVSFLVLNVCAAALYCVLQKRVVGRYPPVFVAAMAFIAATVPIAIAAVVSAGTTPGHWTLNRDSTAFAALAYAIFLTTAFNYSITAWANRESSPTFVTSFQTLQPVTAALVSWAVLGVLLTRGQAVGGIAILLGLLVFLRERPTTAPTRPLLPEPMAYRSTD